MGALFFRGASPEEIERMGYARMRYWARWAISMRDAEKAKADELEALGRG